MLRLRLAATALLAALLLSPLLAATATAQERWYGGAYQRCSGGSTVEIIECTGRLTAKWDKRLNAAYRKLMATLPKGSAQQLRDVQRLWIRYRDANCGYYRSGAGTIAAIEAAECMRVLTANRAAELEQMLQP